MILALCDDTGTRWSHARPMHSVSLPGPGYPLATATGLREHLLWMRLQGRMEDTLTARRRAVVLLGEHLRADPAGATFEQLYSWQLWLLEETSLSTVRHQTALVRPYFAWLRDLGHRRDNPAALLPSPKARRGLPTLDACVAELLDQ